MLASTVIINMKGVEIINMKGDEIYRNISKSRYF